MNFSREEEEELRKLKQKVAQQDATITTLHAEGSKKIKEMKVLSDDRDSLKRKLDEGEDRIALLEDNLNAITKERDQLKTANHNIQQTLTSTQSRLQGKEKDIRLHSIDQERTSQSILQEVEKELEEERRKRIKLEERIQSSAIPPLQHGADRGRNSARLEAKIAALEKENAALKAESTRTEMFVTGSLSPASGSVSKRARRPRSSSVSNGSDVDAQQLRDLLAEANTKADQLEAKVTRAEREKNKACNEQIAAGKASAATIAALQESVIELRDEVQFQRENIIKALEGEKEELMKVCCRIPLLEHELTQSRQENSTLETQLGTNKVDSEKLRADLQVHAAQIAAAGEENAALRKELSIAEVVEKKLKQKEKEVESAKRRTMKLSASIRRMLRSMGDAPANTGDETSQNIVAANDTSVFNMTTMTTSQDYEADLVDDLEQLLQSVDEADRCLDFAQVERKIQVKNVQEAYNLIEGKLRASEEAVTRLEEMLSQRDDELRDVKSAHQELQAEKGQLDICLQEEKAGIQELASQRDDLSEQLAPSRDDNERLRLEGERGQLAQRKVEEKLRALEAKSKQASEDLEAQLQEMKSSQSALQKEVKASTYQVSQLTIAIEDLKNQCAAQEMALASAEREKEAIEKCLADAREDLERLTQSERALQCREAELALALHDQEDVLREQLRASAEREVELISLTIREIQAEREGWETLLHEEQENTLRLANHLAQIDTKSKAALVEKCELVDLVSQERDKASADLTRALGEMQELQLDLQESRMNKQLAEDALGRLYPNHHAVEASQAALIKGWEVRMKSKSEEAELAKSDALRWKTESDEHRKALQEQLNLARESQERLLTLESQVVESQQAQVIAQTSLQTMQGELDARVISLHRLQLNLQTIEEALVDLQAKKKVVEQEKDALGKKLAEALGNATKMADEHSRELLGKEEEIGMLGNEIEGLMHAAAELHRLYKEANRVENVLQARCEELERVCDVHAQVQKEQMERICLLEKAIADGEENTTSRSEKMLALSEELKDAKDGYEMLKRQLEARNVEYWETKEELAEWQERYERSQADLKIKSELEDRLKEATDELERCKGQLDQCKEQCNLLEEDLVSLKKQREEDFSRFDKLTTELHESRMMAASLTEIQQELTDSNALVEQLEYDLAQKAQECEDADDKELALRKDNKRLAAKIATLQARIDKLQQNAVATIMTVPQTTASLNRADMIQGDLETTPTRASVIEVTPPSSRKRRAPEDDDAHNREMDQASAPTLTRAIYAPKTIPSRAIKTTQNASAAAPFKIATHVATSAPIRKVSQSPSDLIAKKMRSPKKDSLQDRTNIQQSRQASEKPLLNGESQHFMAKLNRYRAPTIPLQTTQ